MDWDLGRWYCRWSKLASRCWVQSMWSSYWECIYQSANDQITRDCENSARWMLTWSRKDSGKIHRVKGSLEYRYNQSIRPYHQKQRSRKATLTNPVADLWVFFLVQSRNRHQGWLSWVSEEASGTWTYSADKEKSHLRDFPAVHRLVVILSMEGSKHRNLHQVAPPNLGYKRLRYRTLQEMTCLDWLTMACGYTRNLQYVSSVSRWIFSMSKQIAHFLVNPARV